MFIINRFLKYLNLSHNRIKQIDHSLPYSSEEINLSHNDLEHVQFDMSLSMCELLDVSYNKLKSIHFLKVSYSKSRRNIIYHNWYYLPKIMYIVINV